MPDKKDKKEKKRARGPSSDGDDTEEDRDSSKNQKVVVTRASSRNTHAISKMSVDDAKKGKTIGATHVPTVEVLECKEFSLNIRTILQSLNYWTDGLVATIVKDAETLLNAKDAVQTIPSMTANARRKYFVAAKNCKKSMYECSLQ
ncbi:hypothetical protein OS493_028517 [Desmophyllum pertusum]|uniref:Uncharacterized protein n=1 Tax=Desmophyllum pertusum TaxID=174260 RepID=A0A9X0CXY7_9CNID|nr:hypothetical protein OS493_028517 [Desmophyllum pertusum]